MNKTGHLPYRFCDHIHIQSIGNYTFYIDLFNGGYSIVSNEAHKCITEHVADRDGLSQYIDLTVNELIAKHYIEPDLSKIRIGKSSLYIPKNRWEAKEKIDLLKLHDVSEHEFNMSSFNIEYVKLQKDLDIYEYLCARNSLRVALLGYGVKFPLLWMCNGLFLNDIDFANKGMFSTNFSRQMLDSYIIPVVGEARNSLDWETIDSHLAENSPVLVGVDVYHLPYKYNTYYHNRHGAHIIILLEKLIDSYLILDWCHPDYFYGEISKEDLATARTSNNEKDQESVFNGYPIEASYQLLYMNRLPVKLDLLKHIRNNLYKSAKCMLEPTGAIAFLGKVLQNTPEWIKTYNSVGYKNAIGSFFFLDLELKFLYLYYEEMLNSDICNQFQPQVLMEKIVEIRSSLEQLKSKLIFAYRRNKSIHENIWNELLGIVSNQLGDYCESILRSLITTKKGM